MASSVVHHDRSLLAQAARPVLGIIAIATVLRAGAAVAIVAHKMFLACQTDHVAILRRFGTVETLERAS